MVFKKNLKNLDFFLDIKYKYVYNVFMEAMLVSREYIARALKRLRETTGLKADEVGNMIGKSGKTVNAWENGRGQPDAEMLIKLCGIYKVDNMLAEFDETNSIGNNSVFSQGEVSIIKKYRALDDYGRDMVDTVLDKEYKRCKKMQSKTAVPIVIAAQGGGINTEISPENENAVLNKLEELDRNERKNNLGL